MKTSIKNSLMALALICVSCFSANAHNDDVSEMRKVDEFSSIKITSVATVYFTQSDTFSLKIEGKDVYVKNTTTTVKDGCLFIGFDNKIEEQREGVNIYLSAPDINKIDFTGVGSFNCQNQLNLADVDLNIQGVGKFNIGNLTCNSLNVNMSGVGKSNIHVDCDDLNVRIDGVGYLDLSGSAIRSNISKGGIGYVSTSDLKVGE